MSANKTSLVWNENMKDIVEDVISAFVILGDNNLQTLNSKIQNLEYIEKSFSENLAFLIHSSAMALPEKEIFLKFIKMKCLIGYLS